WLSRLFVAYLWFFFSSRRRHTRSKRDWSSDVCSSDLVILGSRLSPLVPEISPEHAASSPVAAAPPASPRNDLRDSSPAGVIPMRSEERRVGKEWRHQGSPTHWKKTQERTEKTRADEI